MPKTSKFWLIFVADFENVDFLSQTAKLILPMISSTSDRLPA